MADVINLDGELARHNATVLHEVSAELPPSSQILLVDGNNTEPAAEGFTRRLTDQLTALSREVQHIQERVAAQAEAVRAAAAALEGADSSAAQVSSQAAQFFDGGAVPTAGATSGATQFFASGSSTPPAAPAAPSATDFFASGDR